MISAVKCATCAPGWLSWEVIFDQANSQSRITELEARSAQPDFWDDASQAQTVLQQINQLRDKLAPYLALEARVADLETMCELLAEEEEPDEAALEEQQKELNHVAADMERLE